MPHGIHLRNSLRVGIWHLAGAQEMLTLKLNGALFSSQTRVFLGSAPMAVNPNPVVLNYLQINQNSVTFLGISSASSVWNSKWHLVAACSPIPGCISNSNCFLCDSLPPQQGSLPPSLVPSGHLTLLPKTLQNPTHWHQFVFPVP